MVDNIFVGKVNLLVYPLFLSSRGLDKVSLVAFPPIVALVMFVPVVGPQLIQAFSPIVSFWAAADSTVAKTIAQIIAATNGIIDICFFNRREITRGKIKYFHSVDSE